MHLLDLFVLLMIFVVFLSGHSCPLLFNSVAVRSRQRISENDLPSWRHSAKNWANAFGSKVIGVRLYDALSNGLIAANRLNRPATHVILVGNQARQSPT
jgi:hypothetical protein